jgi:hypothetical protein
MFKSLSANIGEVKFHVFLNQSYQQNNNFRVILNKTLVKICKSEKKLYIFHVYKRFLFQNNSDFNKIYTNIVS